MASFVEKGVHYPLADPVRPLNENTQKDWRAVWSGEYRMPKAGEWFLSGAVVEAYQTQADMSVTRHIATLVNIKDVHWVVTKDGKPLASLDTAADAELWLHRHQPMSNYRAKRYDGYAITEVNNNA